MSKSKASVVLNFTVPVESVTDQKAIRAAYTELRKQVAEMALALAADPNIIVAHTQIHGPTLKPAVDPNAATADPHIANLQSINKRLDKKQSVVTDPEFKSKYEASEEETPHIVARDVTAYRQDTGVTAPVVDTQGEALKKFIFADVLRKTPKSLAIMDYLIANRDKPVTVAQIATATNLANGDVSIWLGTTGQNVKGITDAGKRGSYIFDSSKIQA